LVRKALARQLVAAVTPGENDVPALRLAPDLVAVLEAGFDVGETGALRLVGLAAAIDAVCAGVASAQRRLGGVELIVISPPLIRGPLRRGLHGRLHPLPAFLAEDEVDSSVPIRSVGLVSLAGKFVPEAPAGD
jgi:flagellar biosynthesis component FlhA